MGRPPAARRRLVLLGIAVALVATNLRPALASVGPVLGDIRADLHLSSAVAAVLTAAGVICFGVLAPAAPRLARRWGMEAVVAGVLAAIALGLGARAVGGVAVLFAGTVLAAGGIAVANVLLPALIKRDFPHHTGTMMGVYTMALSGAAAIAAGVTVPLAQLTALDWRGGLGFWALPALVALAAWLPFVRGRSVPPAAPRGGSLLRDRLAWQVTTFFGLQSLMFYSVLAWLPTIYRDLGYSSVAAGVLLSVSALVQTPVSLVLPRLAGRRPDQRLYAAGATLFTAAGLLGVLLAPTTAPYLWMALLGVGQGSTFAIGLSLIVWRTRTSGDTARLSAMSQTIGYSIAAAGPLLVGWVHDLAGSWEPALWLMVALLVPQLVTGVLAGRDRFVGRQGTGPSTETASGPLPSQG